MTALRRAASRLVRGGVRAIGFDLVRRPRGHVWGQDPFADQRQLLCGGDVRTVFDVGANVGQTTARYRELFPAATIHAFEPFPASYTSLCERHAGTPQVVPHPFAVAERAGPKVFYANRSPATNSLLAPIDGAARIVGPGLMDNTGTVEVQAVRLDEFCDTHRIPTVDILKFDIQGGEGLALAGAADLLRRKAIKLIYTEVLFAPMYAGQANLWDVRQAVAEAGYELFGLYHLVHAGTEGLAWADAIFIPR